MISNAKKKSGCTTGTSTTQSVERKPQNLRSHSITKKRKCQALFFIIAFITLSAVTALTVMSIVKKETYTLQPIECKVKSGDTLWTIAQEHKPDDVLMQEYMAFVYEHNEGGMIYPGDIVTIAEVVR